MAYICEKELISIYNSLEPSFLVSGLEPEIALIRDYLLKIKISENDKVLGKLIIDYSPKKQSYNYRRDSDLPEDQFVRIIALLGETDRLKAKTSSENKNQKKQKTDLQKIKVSTSYYAYVDGSFIEGNTGYGAVILKEGSIVAELSGKLDTPEAFNARQVGGEIQAVIEVLEWCKKENVKEISIFYDFQNIEKWATGKFRTNTPMTQAYKEYIDSCGIAITWYRVESHTGIELNDRADLLAKNGARQ
jgi:ribonuclease HI